MEMESGNSPPFLDTILTRQSDGSLDVAIYRKPTHTDRYLNFSSNHPAHVKQGLAAGLFRRARTIAQGQNISEEENHVCEVLRANGYPKHLIFSSMKPRKKKDLEEKPEHTIVLPYVSSLSEDLRRIYWKHGIWTVFTTYTTLHQQLTKVKDMDSPLKRSGVVHQIPCSCGLAYIGETKRALVTRLKEHKTVT